MAQKPQSVENVEQKEKQDPILQQAGKAVSHVLACCDREQTQVAVKRFQETVKMALDENEKAALYLARTMVQVTMELRSLAKLLESQMETEG